MRQKMQLIPVLLLVCISLCSIVLVSINLNNGEGFLAYPPPPTWPGENGYPGPGFAAPTATSTPTKSDIAEAATSTPWPTPTGYAVTPALTPRQGVAGGQQYYPDRYRFGSWGWHWGYFPPSGFPATTEHVPMLVWRPWGVLDDRLVTITTTPAISATPPVYVGATRTPEPTPLPAYIAYMSTRTPHDYWLIFNECEHQYQCWTSPENAAVSYQDFLVAFIEDHPNEIGTPKLIIGGVNAHVCGIQWLKNFITEYRTNNQGNNPPYLAGWHFHLYPEIAPRDWVINGMNGTVGCESDWIFYDPRMATVDLAWSAWLEDVGNIREFLDWYGDDSGEIWITEMGCLSGGNHGLPVNPPAPTPTPTRIPMICQASGFMYEYVTRITGWLNSNGGRWIDRYAWYTDYNLGWWEHTKLYAFTPPPTSPPTATLGGPPTPTRTPTLTPTPGPSPTRNRSALGIYYGQITPAAAGEFDELLPVKLFLPVVAR